MKKKLVRAHLKTTFLDKGISRRRRREFLSFKGMGLLKNL